MLGGYGMKRLYGSLLILSMIWGMSFLFIKLLVVDLGPWGVVFWRCLFGTLTLAFILFIFQKHDVKNLKQLPWFALFFVGLFNNALPFGFIAMSELNISSSLASVINATTPIWTMIIGSVFFLVGVNKRQWVGIAIGFLGIIVLLNVNVKGLIEASFIGAGTMLLATFCYGLGAQLARKFLQNIPITVVSVSTLAMSTLISFILMLITNEPIRVSSLASFDIFLSLVGLGVFGTGIAYLFYYYMVKEGSAEFASLVTYIVPITAMIWGSLLLGEQITVNMMIGLMFIFGGVYLSSARRRKVSGEI